MKVLHGGPRPAQVQMLPGFEHMQRFWDPQLDAWNVKILPGEYYVTRGDEAISTVLGSCISACIRDPVRNVGGMNHFMLPEDSSVGPNSWLDPSVGLANRYGSHAMESLVNDLLKLGATRERLDIAFLTGYLSLEKYRVAAEDLGGTQPRKVVYFPANGRVRLRKLRPVENRIISHHERLYLQSIGHHAADGGDVELFE